MIPGLLAVGLFLLTIAVYVRFFPEAGPSREPMDRQELECDSGSSAGFSDLCSGDWWNLFWFV